MHQDLKKQQQQQTSTTTQLLCLPLTDRTWTVRRDIGHHITTCSAIKAVEEEGGRSGFQSGHCFSPFFPHLLSCLYPDPWVFSLLFFLLSPPVLLGTGSEQVATWVLGCWPGQPTSHLNLPSAVRRGLQGSSEHRVSFTWFPQEAFLPVSSLGTTGESLNLMERQ